MYYISQLILLVAISYNCTAQNILIFASSQSTSDLGTALNFLGYTYTLVEEVPLISSDFDGINVFFDIVITAGQCGTYYTDSIPVIKEYMDKGGSVYWDFENPGFNTCNQEKLDNFVNPYINLPNITLGTGYKQTGSCSMASSLPAFKNCALTSPNDISGTSTPCGSITNFTGSIDPNSILFYDDTTAVGAIYSGSDVLIDYATYVLWGDSNHDFNSMGGVDVLDNIVRFLYNSCCSNCPSSDVCDVDTCVCDVANECNGRECGIGACGSSCTNSCNATEICSNNTCVCDVANECNERECGIGACGTACANTCNTTEICSNNTCICDVANECNGIECGFGACGGSCTNSCNATEICSNNICVCDVANECNGIECGIGACGNACPYTCNATEICSNNTCVCDVANECNGIECGTGTCGGSCAYTCNTTEICSNNICVCDVANECNGRECGIGACGGPCASSCGPTEICSNNICICDISNECNGRECGTGACGGSCTNSCGTNEICSNNTCVCDVANECNGRECGTGVCEGPCPNTCSPSEVCSSNTCICDVTNECNGVECGIGACGGSCPDTCSPTEICSINTCICDVANECNGRECGIGACGNACPDTCSAELLCSGNMCTQSQMPTPPNTPSTTTSITPSPSMTGTPSGTTTETLQTKPSSKTPNIQQTQTQTPTPTNTMPLQLLGPINTILPTKQPSNVPSFQFFNTPVASPTSASDLCFNSPCSIGKEQTIVNSNGEVSLVTDDGIEIGNILFSNIEGIADITFAAFSDMNSNEPIGNSVVDITILDFAGNSLTRLTGSVEICLTEEQTSKNVCLGFYNTQTGEWECEDKCLTKKNDRYCGKTDHLTSFALLLNGGGVNNGQCNTSNDYTFAWISMGMIILALFIIFGSVILIELRYQHRNYRRRKVINTIERTLAKRSSLL